MTTGHSSSLSCLEMVARVMWVREVEMAVRRSSFNRIRAKTGQIEGKANVEKETAVAIEIIGA